MLAEVADEATLRTWNPDHDSIGALAHGTESMGLCAFARRVSTAPALVVRAFPAGVGITEDPASGAANGLIAAYLAQSEPTGRYAHGYVVSQGREIGHDAELIIRIAGPTYGSAGARTRLFEERLTGMRTQPPEPRTIRQSRVRSLSTPSRRSRPSALGTCGLRRTSVLEMPKRVLRRYADTSRKAEDRQNVVSSNHPSSLSVTRHRLRSDALGRSATGAIDPLLPTTSDCFREE